MKILTKGSRHFIGMEQNFKFELNVLFFTKEKIQIIAHKKNALKFKKL